MAFGSSKLGGAPLNEREQLSNYVKLLLLWVAASDGKIEEAEAEFAAAQFPGPSATVTTNELLAVIRNGDLRTIEKALRAVAAESRELRLAFLDLAVTMSTADRSLAISENHILRFYADALHLGLAGLQKRFQAITGYALPEPGDPSRPEWWDPAAGDGPESNPESGSRIGQ